MNIEEKLKSLGAEITDTFEYFYIDHRGKIATAYWLIYYTQDDLDRLDNDNFFLTASDAQFFIQEKLPKIKSHDASAALPQKNSK